MKSMLLAVSAIIAMSVSAQAADVVCSCANLEDVECSDIRISFVPANPGVYMNVEFAYGDKNTEGFATVTRQEETGRTIYTLANFILVEENNQYSLPGRLAICN